MKYSLNGKVYVRSVNLSASGLIFLILSGLIGNLRSCSPDMFKFYSYLKDRAPQIPLSTEEKKIASGDIELSSAKLTEITQRHDARQQSLKNVFARQQEKAAVSNAYCVVIFSFLPSLIFIQEPWSQETFEDLLTKWIVASDQPFDEVENPELSELLNYVNRSASPLKIPGRFTVKRRVMKMGAEGIQYMKDLFAVRDMLTVYQHTDP